GRRCMPDASRVSCADGIAWSEPTDKIAPSLMAMLASITLSGLTILPPRMTRSAVTMAASQHGPAAVDRQVDAGDLARGVAGEEQTGVGDIGVVGDAFEGVVGGVALHCFVDANAELFRHLGADLVAEARPIDHAGRHAIDVDVVGPDLERKALGDAAQPP